MTKLAISVSKHRSQTSPRCIETSAFCHLLGVSKHQDRSPRTMYRNICASVVQREGTHAMSRLEQERRPKSLSLERGQGRISGRLPRSGKRRASTSASAGPSGTRGLPRSQSQPVPPHSTVSRWLRPSPSSCRPSLRCLRCRGSHVPGGAST